MPLLIHRDLSPVTNTRFSASCFPVVRLSVLILAVSRASSLVLVIIFRISRLSTHTHTAFGCTRSTEADRQLNVTMCSERLLTFFSLSPHGIYDVSNRNEPGTQVARRVSTKCRSRYLSREQINAFG
jgi:hypothetical protein